MNFLGTLFFLVVSILNLSLVSASEDGLQQVLLLAKQKKLSNTRAWNKLLHIEPNAIGFKKSQITDPKFFLSNKTHLNKYDELEATLRSFAEEASYYKQMIDAPIKKMEKENGQKLVDHSQHPICRFPARLKWLRQQLAEAKGYWSSLPTVECVYHNVFMDAVRPKTVSFVFSSYYSDSPGSAFGHTFFRINKSDFSTERQELLDYGVGYAANVTVSNGFLYAMFGLVGGFTGSWTNIPYYYKVREYNDFEARDLWSYELNLTADEVEMLVLHLWEVGEHYYTYYFFSQNCAYHMLTVLEAAAPRLHLIEHVPFYYIIPSDSIKALFKEEGLVTNISFRPSVRKTFLERFQKMELKTQEDFKQYAKNGEKPKSFSSFSKEQQSYFLDTAIDLFDLRHPTQQMDGEKDKQKEKEKLLADRAAIDFISPTLKINPDLQDEPAKSHGSSRIGLNHLFRGKNDYSILSYRFAIHDLLDSQIGLPRNSQLEFFNFNFRLKKNNLYLHDFFLFRVMNLNPINFFETKASWGVDIGVQSHASHCVKSDFCNLIGGTFKYGYSTSYLPKDRLMAWGFVTANLRYSDALLNSRDYLAPGLEIGALHRWSDRQAILTRYMREYPYKRSFVDDYLVEYRYSIKEKYQFGVNIKNDFYGVLTHFYL